MKFSLRKCNALSGTTLTEVVVALAVVGITSAGVLGSVGYSFKTVDRIRENQRATQILVEKLETIRLYSWTQINTAGFVPATFTDVYAPQETNGNQGLTYYGTLTITNFAPSTSYRTNMRQLSVTLTWTNRDGLPHTRSLNTLIARDGSQNYIY